MMEELKARAAFTRWMKEKGISFSEISILKKLSPPAALPLLEWVERCRPSRQTGLEVIELTAELSLMQKPLPKELFKRGEKAPKALLNRLRLLRRPLSFASDQRKAMLCKSLTLPKNITVRHVREGDQSGLDIRLKVFSERSFLSKARFLLKLSDRLKEEGLWKS